MVKLDCHNQFYIPNLTIELENAIGEKDIQRIIALAGEIERFKTLCGYIPAIQRFEESIKMYGHELNLLAQPEIKRALETVPRKTCSRCKCGESEQSSHQEGFANMVQSAFGNQNAQAENRESESHPNSEFSRMLEESGKGSTEREQPHTPIPNIVTMTGMLRMVDESQFPQFCDPEKCPKNFSRHCRANTEAHRGQPCIYLTEKNR